MLARSSRLALLAALSVSFGLGLACYSGYELEDKEPPPGYPGGACLPQGCYDVVECYVEHQVCFDPAEPCKGIYCGGNGICVLDMNNGNKPMCQCDPGYNNNAFAFFCVPG